jgi:outer membrane immunogenic protein
MHKHFAGLVAALTLMSGTAIADGMNTRGSIRDSGHCCEAAPTWTGFYLGAGIGAGAVVHDTTAAGGLVNLDGFGGEGVFGTLTVGYDRQFGKWVGGVFLDYDFSNISTDFRFGNFSTSLDHDRSWSIGGRLGYLTSPSTLWYGMAGYTRASFDDISIEPGFSLSVPDFSGYFVGAGVESRLGGNWSLRAEYRFTQLDSEQLSFRYSGEGESGSYPSGIHLEPSMHTARAVLTYRFGERAESSAHQPMK